MPSLKAIQLAWSTFFSSAANEHDPGFRKVMLRLCRNGMIVAGALGIIGVLANITFYLEDGWALRWWYDESARAIALWHRSTIVVLCSAYVGLAYTPIRLQWARFIGAFIVLTIGLTVLVDDLYQIEEGFHSDRYLSVAMLVIVAAIPYRPRQAFVLFFAMWGLYLLSYWTLPGLLGREAATAIPGLWVYIFLVPLASTGISAILYNSRYAQYKTRRRIETLKKQREEANTLLEEANTLLEESIHKLTETQDQLIHAQKMASLGRLTSGIAHEIRNPLNFINNFSELSGTLTDELLEELAAFKDHLDPTRTEPLAHILNDLRHNTEQIHKHGQRAENIIRSIVDHARTQGDEHRAVDLHALLEQCISLAYADMRASTTDFTVGVERDYDDAVSHVHGIPQELGRVFRNLLNNAFEAVHRRWENEHEAYTPALTVGTRQRDGTVRVRVSDNGAGIAETIRDRIFEPFFTTKPPGSGTGLGLFIAYDIITQGHKGTLKIEHSTPAGTTFAVTLPG